MYAFGAGCKHAVHVGKETSIDEISLHLHFIPIAILQQRQHGSSYLQKKVLPWSCHVDDQGRFGVTN